jgi:hypothetical protein
VKTRSYRLFLGSQGIWKVDDNSNVTPFIQDPMLMSVLGLQIDKTRNHLHMCNNNAAAAWGGVPSDFYTSLVTADLTTGAILSSVDVSAIGPQGPKFGNDLTVDKDGNVYMTDSFNPQIWKISTDGVASQFATDPRWYRETGGVGLNGIDYHPDGYIITVRQTCKKI